jgi:ubiquinone/menaquinone biosynthesis C-methylase UbiE
MKLAFYIQTLRTALAQLRSPRTRVHRDESFVEAAYDHAYEQTKRPGHAGKTLESDQTFWDHDMIVRRPGWQYKAAIIRELADAIDAYHIGSVLDLGCGRGIFALSLACLRPSIAITGIELTSEGVAAAHLFRRDPPIPALAHLTGLTTETIRARLRTAKVDFVQGSITTLPFPDRSFDLVFSNSVIEQIPRRYEEVFREAARVACKAAYFSEPFREAQRNVLHRLYLRNIDYFRWSYRVVERNGLRVVRFTVAPLQKFAFACGQLLAEPEP